MQTVKAFVHKLCAALITGITFASFHLNYLGNNKTDAKTC
jgi:hypothetical protein